MDFYRRSREWDALLSNRRYALIAFTDNDKPIGFVDVEIDADSANIAYYVRPEYRMKGLGKAMLEKTLSWIASQTQAVVVCAFVDPDNVASVRCLESCGFTMRPSTGDLRHYERDVLSQQKI